MGKVNEIEDLLEESRSLALEYPQQSYDMAFKAYLLSMDEAQPLKKGYALFQMAYACRVMSDYSKGLNYALESLDLFMKEENALGIIKAKNIIGIIYFYFGDYTSATDYFFKALELINTEKNYDTESAILNNIGEIYREAKQYDKAIIYYEKALSISLSYQLPLNASAIYLNIGETHYLQGNTKASLLNFNKSYDLVKDKNCILIQGEIETKLGRSMYLQDDFKAAREYYFSALSKFNKINNKFYLMELLINLALFEEAMGRTPLKYLQEALHIAEANGFDVKISLTLKLLGDHYEKKHDYKKSLEYFKSYFMKEKEIEMTNLSKKLEILSIEFDYYKEKNDNKKFKALSEKLKRDISLSNKELKEMKEKNALLMKENLVDELTQIYNKRGIYKSLTNLMQVKSDLLEAVFIIDIDFFKQYNDSWGHIQGDYCLKKISALFKALPYKDYFVGRFGGEEFLCFLRADTRLAALEIAETLRQLVEDLRMPLLKEEDDVCVTVSIGGVVGKMETCNLDELIDKADIELYKSKESGRNKVSITYV